MADPVLWVTPYVVGRRIKNQNIDQIGWYLYGANNSVFRLSIYDYILNDPRIYLISFK